MARMTVSVSGMAMRRIASRGQGEWNGIDPPARMKERAFFIPAAAYHVFRIHSLFRVYSMCEKRALAQVSASSIAPL